MTITVYSKPACPQCVATTRALEAQGTAFDYVDLSTDPSAMEFVQTLGYRAAPVVVAGDTHWSGFQPGKIKTLS